jgi:glucose-6-phosphate isomerase
MRTDVTFDYANLLSEAVGPEEGVTERELNGVVQDCRRYHQELERERRAGDLGFIQLPYDTAEVEVIRAAAHKLAGRCENFVVLGIGGSALGNIMLQDALRPPFYNLLPRVRRGGPRLFVLDNVDPTKLAALLDLIDLEETVFNVITKSGSTAETMAQFLIVAGELRRRLSDRYREQVVVTTDPERGPLRAIATSEQLPSLPIPPTVGGRFSVLSSVGLLSAAVTGVDVEALLAGAQAMDHRASEPDLRRNPAYLFAALHYLLYQKGKHLHVMMPYVDGLASFADWFRQLWAESLGKERSGCPSADGRGERVSVGPTPIKGLGVTDQHAQLQLYVEGPADKVFTFVAVEEFERDLVIPDAFPQAEALSYLPGHSLGELLQSERRATTLVLTERHRPNSTLTLPRLNPHALGQLIHLFAVATAFSGKLYRINPFDQPGVEAGKEATYALMGRSGYEALRREIEGKLASGTTHLL